MALTSAYKYESLSGTAGAAYITIPFTFSSRWIDIYISNNSATVRVQKPGGTFGDEIIFDPIGTDFPIPFFFQTRAIQIRNTNPVLNADYQFVPNA